MHLKRSHKNTEILILPLRDVVVYPNMIVPLFIGRKKSIFCLELSMQQNKKILLVAQKKASTNEPNINDLFKIGTVSSILQVLKLPDGTIKILVEGLERAKIIEIQDKGKYFIALVKKIHESKINKKEKEIITKTLINQFEYYIKISKKIPIEVLNSLNHINNPVKLADTIATHIPLKLNSKQHILEITNINKRLEYLIAMIESEINILKIEKKIRNRIKKQMEKSQKEYYLNEQIKAIQKELGEINSSNEYELLYKKFKNTKIPKEIKKKTKIELQKLKLMSPLSAEATVIRNYID